MIVGSFRDHLHLVFTIFHPLHTAIVGFLKGQQLPPFIEAFLQLGGVPLRDGKTKPAMALGQSEVMVCCLPPPVPLQDKLTTHSGSIEDFIPKGMLSQLLHQSNGIRLLLFAAFLYYFGDKPRRLVVFNGDPVYGDTNNVPLGGLQGGSKGLAYLNQITLRVKDATGIDKSTPRGLFHLHYLGINLPLILEFVPALGMLPGILGFNVLDHCTLLGLHFPDSPNQLLSPIRLHIFHLMNMLGIGEVSLQQTLSLFQREVNGGLIVQPEDVEGFDPYPLFIHHPFTSMNQ